MAKSSVDTTASNYWDAQLYALEYELNLVAKSFPITPARCKQFSEEIVKTASTCYHGFSQVFKDVESKPQIAKWQDMVGFLKRNPRAISPTWKVLMNHVKGEAQTKELKELMEKLNDACTRYNSERVKELANGSGIIENVDKMVEQINIILKQDKLTNEDVESVTDELSKFNLLDCRFQRVTDQYDHAIAVLQRHVDKRDARHASKIAELEAAKKREEERFNSAADKIAKLEAKTKDLESTRFEDKNGKDMLAKRLKSQADIMAEMRKDNAELKNQVMNVELKFMNVELQNQEIKAFCEEILKYVKK